MRYYDEEEIKELNVEQWQIDLLELNPEYISWGPHEDYMWKDGTGWDRRLIFNSWSDFGPWELDDLNECVNFYFSVNRENEECSTCGGNGYHPCAQKIVNAFYAHMNQKGEHWNDKITQDEVETLIKANRLYDFTRNKPEGYIPSADEVNASQNILLVGHDAINRGILISTRLKRLGIPKTCPQCNGSGIIYTESKAYVTLTLWMLHPCKGCSRGVEISRIEQNDLSSIFSWLKAAAMRNANRFSKLS